MIKFSKFHISVNYITIFWFYQARWSDLSSQLYSRCSFKAQKKDEGTGSREFSLWRLPPTTTTKAWWMTHTTKRYITDRWTRRSIAYFRISLSNRRRRRRIIFSIIAHVDFIISSVVETNNHRTRCFSLHVSYLHEYSNRWSTSLSSGVL